MIPGYNIIPLIYHKSIKDETIINFIEFTREKANDLNEIRTEFEPIFKQDSLFLLIDKLFPNLKLYDSDGTVVSSNSFKGKPTLINFWATWCGPCVKEIPDLNNLQNRFGNDMNFIAIACEKPEYQNNIKLFLEKNPFNFIILFDPERSRSQYLKISGIPTNIFIDRNGYVRYIKYIYNPTNNDDTDMFIKIIKELIKNGS
jgi:thiol-disulfide isomerase/thioredoxin